MSRCTARSSGVIAFDEVGDARAAALTGDALEFFRIRQSRGEWLFDEHMMPRFKCSQRLAMVQCGWRGDVHQIDVRRAEDALWRVRRRMQLRGGSFGGGRIDVSDPGDVDVRQLAILPHREPCEGTAADEPDPQRLGSEWASWSGVGRGIRCAGG